ncbi:electroneutral sodium bicarbonate exchanger 1-like [Mytilus californianus]|uniref:electroneutral sodium bicarbonate exchanger 1-like n=1 Tax=Mytilus californianus TaxID=6549 RepID=UPI00224750BE|nr:electroneutral sodium bicarbonate exchanger 1-like [Mytilus californianus]
MNGMNGSYEVKNGEHLSHRKRSLAVTEFIQGLLTKNDDETHVVFCQLDTLTKKDEEVIWRESARWVKYEEDVEENGKRWSKPHVASVTLHNVLELRTQMFVGALLNKPFMKKIPEGAQVANVWVGEIDDLKEPITAFIRLDKPRVIGDLTEVPLPTRFIFLHLSPVGEPGHIFAIGRAMSNMMVDVIFSEVAYKAKSREDIMHGFDEFLDQTTVLPPGQWDPEIRLEPPTKVPSQEGRRRLFGGLIEDVKRKIPFYISDFKDGFHIQCLGAVLFMYLATLTPNITFGALLGQSTHHYMGTMECIVAVAFVNLIFALFGGQPLIIMGSTGPVLVLEIIIYTMCRDNDWDFLPFRCLVGLWSALFLLIIVAFDLSALVRYITRFTEESFACLIAIIFIVEAFKKIFSIAETHPFNIHPEIPLDYTCFCVTNNQSSVYNMTTMPLTTNAFNSTTDAITNWTSVQREDCVNLGGVLEGSGCGTTVYHDNVFFLSFIIGVGTFGVAWALVNMKKSTFFPTVVRQTIGDFAVFISICTMVLLDVLLGVPTPKLMVPNTIQPSRPDRGWFTSPYSPHNPWWVWIATALPALVAVILIFMDQQITAVIINRKENKLKKGCGYHLDLTVTTFCLVVCSFFGLPWYVAATVRSMAHVNSLKMESECTAPGEKPVFLGCREQRLTPLIIAILNGCSVFMTSILQLVPMPVLYGVFLYMGVSALRGMQFMDRMMIMLMPAKYQPDHMYLRHVRIKRVHLFTFFQILCLGILWAIKAIKTISIVFPVMVLGTCFVRKGMERIFSKNELKWLDELMPEDKMMKQEDEGELIVDDDDMDDDEDDGGPIEFLQLKKYRKIGSVDNMPWNLKQDSKTKYRKGPDDESIV